jgi:hypothetical protein
LEKAFEAIVWEDLMCEKDEEERKKKKRKKEEVRKFI